VGSVMPELFHRAALGVPGVTGGFSNRYGGTKPDELCREAGLNPALLFMVEQVHGRAVERVDRSSSLETVRVLRADGLITTDPGVIVAVRTADCVPVLIADRRGRVVGAAHSGWRGHVAGIVDSTVEAMAQAVPGLGIEDLVVSVGPAISGCCFEVSEEVAAEILTGSGAATEDELIRRRSPRPHLELRRAVVGRLRAIGFSSDSIALVGPCTRCAASTMSSYRREGPGGGRQISFSARR